MNGLYDWGWIGTDPGVAMPPSDQLDELGALAVTIDENYRSYSLATICERCGLPGKDETLLREAVMRPAWCRSAARRSICSRTSGNCRHDLSALRRGRRGADARSVRNAGAASSTARDCATPTGSTST